MRVLLAALMLVAAVAEAQPGPPSPMPHGKWWRQPELVQKLELNREQQKRLDAIFQAAADELIDAKADTRKLEVALRGELDRTQLRRAEIQRIATQLSAARAKLFERELMMLIDMRGVLDENQWELLQDEMPRGPGRRGPPQH
jgi:Spy/CpxP family protein refolding chaperone